MAEVVSKAQPVPKLSVEFCIGPSFPVGKFADKNYSAVPNASGLAKTGFSIYANLRYTFSNHFGLALTTESSFNKQDPAAISNYINQGANYPLDTRIKTDDWRIFKILTGLYYQGYFNNKKLSYLISILGGACKTSAPSYNWAVYTQSGSFYNGQQMNSVPLPWSFGYQAVGGLEYEMKKNMNLLFSADYFSASSRSSTSNLKYDFSSINIMVGAGLRF